MIKLISNLFKYEKFICPYESYPKIDYTKLVTAKKKYQKIDYTKLVTVDKYDKFICIYTLQPCKYSTQCKQNKVCELFDIPFCCAY
jgi:hypothetical protein